MSSRPHSTGMQTVLWIRAVLLEAVVIAGCLAAGCSGSQESAKDDDAATQGKLAERRRNANLSTDYSVRKFDLNADGRADQVHFRTDEGALVRVERDLNFDGVYDAWEHYRGGQLAETEIDLDLDGTVDVVEFIEGGKVTVKQYAMGFRADLVIAQTYDGRGRRTRLERDTNGDGRADVWEHFRPGKDAPFRVEVDTDGDGRPDKVKDAQED